MYRQSDEAMTIYIATLSNDLDGKSIREEQIEAHSKEVALDKLEAICTGPHWQGWSLTNIRATRGGSRPGAGRPKGHAQLGSYGKGIATKAVRVPLNIADELPGLIQNLEELKILLSSWEVKAENSASAEYDYARKLLAEIRQLGF